MTGYIVRRLLGAIPTLLVVVVLIFALLRLAPGDPAQIIAGQNPQKGEIEEIRRRMGLDKPIVVQLGIWFKDISRLDLGQSLLSKHEVKDLLARRMVPTITLTILIVVFAIVTAIPLGVLAAWKANTWIDWSIMVFSTLGFAIPVFWLGYMLVWLFAIKLDLFPAAGYVKPQEDLGAFAHRLVLPTLSTGVILMAWIARMTRATVLETLKEDYVRTAWAKGLTGRDVLIRHALRNAALPIMTIIGLSIASVIGGVVVTENVFAIPGLGRLLVVAILNRDYPIIQGAILVISAFYVLINLLVDISYAYFDPRVRY